MMGWPCELCREVESFEVSPKESPVFGETEAGGKEMEGQQERGPQKPRWGRGYREEGGDPSGAKWPCQ